MQPDFVVPMLPVDSFFNDCSHVEHMNDFRDMA